MLYVICSKWSEIFTNCLEHFSISIKPIFAQQVLTFCLKFHEPTFSKTDNGNIYPPQIIFYFNIWQMWNCLIFNSLYWHIEYLAQ